MTIRECERPSLPPKCDRITELINSGNRCCAFKHQGKSECTILRKKLIQNGYKVSYEQVDDDMRYIEFIKVSKGS